MADDLGAAIAEMWAWANDSVLLESIAGLTRAGCVEVPVLLNAELDRRAFDLGDQPLVQAAMF